MPTEHIAHAQKVEIKATLGLTICADNPKRFSVGGVAQVVRAAES